MKTFTSVASMQAFSHKARLQGKTIGFVPTMGFLHEGHLSLVRASKKKTDVTVVSIFVNPTQFGPREDFKKYPRDLERDSRMLREEGVDVLFAPGIKEMYPEGYRTYVEVTRLQDVLCGASRRGHFRGVCTVVLKLFHIVKPDVAFFGQKDAQQAVIIRRMVRDLHLNIRIETLPIVREPDGLAMSSRNAYLNPEERQAARVLVQSLRAAQRMVQEGERDSGRLKQALQKIIRREPLARIDYVAVVDPEELMPVDRIAGRVLVALAVYIGRTRLIDNILVRSKERKT